MIPFVTRLVWGTDWQVVEDTASCPARPSPTPKRDGAPQSCSARGLRVYGWPMALAVGDTIGFRHARACVSVPLRHRENMAPATRHGVFKRR